MVFEHYSLYGKIGSVGQTFISDLYFCGLNKNEYSNVGY